MPPNNPYFSPQGDQPQQPAAPQYVQPVQQQPVPVQYTQPQQQYVQPMQQPPVPIGVPPTQVPMAPPTMQPMGPVPPQAAATPAGNGQTTPGRPTPKNPNSTQSMLQFSELRDNMIIMSDGSFRAVITCKSINFDLMSGAEREGVEMSYQNFLNSLNFPVQIVIRSQRVDIGPYIDKLLDIRNNQDNMLVGVLMDDYINFIDQLSQEANIMAKSFFVTVPFFPEGDGSTLVEKSKGFFGQLFAAPKKTVTKIDRATYEKARQEIANRTEAVMSGLFQIGVQAVQLNTKELGELYYNFYNPDTAMRQPLGNYENVTATYVRKATEGNI